MPWRADLIGSEPVDREETVRRLVLLRHAKSDWDEPSLPDRDRPLAPRGRRDARLLADHLRTGVTAVDRIVCSPARRARETLDAVRDAWEPPPPVVIDERVYGASLAVLVGVVAETATDVTSLMLIGHNPTLQLAVLTLAGDGEPHALDAARQKYPTGALAVLEWPGEWDALAPGVASLRSFTAPKQLRR
jgi:phosphohistidine phosphatase